PARPGGRAGQEGRDRSNDPPAQTLAPQRIGKVGTGYPTLRNAARHEPLRRKALMNREYVKWDSPILGRSMELLRFGHAGRPMIWFPTSKGRFYQNEDFGLVGGVGDLAETGDG